MSIIRFGEEDSDVYVYLSARGFECCGCSFVMEGFSAPPRAWCEMAAHLETHRLYCDVVPEIAFELGSSPSPDCPFAVFLKRAQNTISPPLCWAAIGMYKICIEAGADNDQFCAVIEQRENAGLIDLGIIQIDDGPVPVKQSSEC